MRSKALFLWGLLTCLFLGACTLHYDISTTKGDIVRATTKPQLDAQGRDYVFKDAQGQEVRINRLRVRKIEPVHPGDPPSRSFN